MKTGSGCENGDRFIFLQDTPGAGDTGYLVVSRQEYGQDPEGNVTFLREGCGTAAGCQRVVNFSAFENGSPKTVALTGPGCNTTTAYTYHADNGRVDIISEPLGASRHSTPTTSAAKPATWCGTPGITGTSGATTSAV